MRKILPNNPKTKKYLDSLEDIWIVVLWEKYGTCKYKFSGKCDKKDKITPLVYMYYDQNGECDEYHLVPISKVTSGVVVLWTKKELKAKAVANLLNAGGRHT